MDFLRFVQDMLFREVDILTRMTDTNKQDGRLAPAYFSPSYKYFDQLLHKNETTVLNLVFKGFLQTSIPPIISIFYAKEGVSQFSVEKFLSHSTETFRRETLLCFRKFLVSKNVKDKRGGGHHDFPLKLFCLTVPKHFVKEPFRALFQKIFVCEKVYG